MLKLKAETILKMIN